MSILAFNLIGDFLIYVIVLFTCDILLVLVELNIGLAWASASKIAPFAEKAGSSRLVDS